MKNFIFISPNFPMTYWKFCRELKNNGMRVLGIGDSPYDDLLQELRDSLAEITTALGGLSDDIGDLQYERLSQAQDFYTSRGWCPGAKKEMLCKMHASYRAKGRNHLSEHYEEEILRLADKPEKEEDA